MCVGAQRAHQQPSSSSRRAAGFDQRQQSQWRTNETAATGRCEHLCFPLRYNRLGTCPSAHVAQQGRPQAGFKGSAEQPTAASRPVATREVVLLASLRTHLPPRSATLHDRLPPLRSSPLRPTNARPAPPASQQAKTPQRRHILPPQFVTAMAGASDAVLTSSLVLRAPQASAARAPASPGGNM